MLELARSQLRPHSPSVVSSDLQSSVSWTPKASSSPRGGTNISSPGLPDLPNGGVRASLLVRMWKEVESEAALKAGEGCTYSPRPPCSIDPAVDYPAKQASTSTRDASPPTTEHESIGGIEHPDDEYNTAENFEPPTEQAFDTGQCGGRVADIVRKLSMVTRCDHGATPAASASATPTAAAAISAFSQKNEGAARSMKGVNEETSRAVIKLQDDYPQPRNETKSNLDEIKIEGRSFNRNSPRFRGRLATIDLLARMKHERQRELGAVEESRAVSEFSHRNRIHALLKFKCLHKKDMGKNQNTHALIAPKLKALRLDTATPPLRESLRLATAAISFSSISDSPTNSVPDDANRLAQGSDLMEPMSVAASSGSFTRTATLEEEEEEASDTVGDRSILLAKQLSFSDRGHPHEESEENSDVLLEDGSSLAGNAEWDGGTDVATPVEWQGGASPDHQEDPASDMAQDDYEPLQGGRWMEFLSVGSYRPWESCKRSVRYDWFDSTSDNPELEQLLKWKSVSTSLASGFRKKMDQLIMSHLTKQEQHELECEDVNTNEEGHKPLQQRNNVGAHTGQATALSRSEMPQLIESLEEREDHQHHKVSAGKYPRLSEPPEFELVCSLKGEISQLRHWMYKLQKTVESCMDMQVELQQTMRQVVSAVLHNSGNVEELPICYKQVSNNRGNCSICRSIQIDSILYRCGHMCTCFNCAHELRWSCGTCPVCLAPIDDVVRTYPDAC